MNQSSEQEKRLEYLLGALKEDSIQYRDLEYGNSWEDKRMAVRSLMNIRMPKVIDEKILKIQDEFLQEEAKEKGIVSIDQIPTVKEVYGSTKAYSNRISIWQGDITRLAVDAIVNAANSQMLGCFVPCHKCIDNAIHSAAGMQLREECNQRMNQKKIQYGPKYEEPTGRAMLTGGYNLPAKHVIHTVGPIVGWKLTEALRNDLRNCYENVLRCAMNNNIRSIAFCCISTGEFRFPNDEAAKIAVETVMEFLQENEEAFDKIIFNVFKDLDKEIYEELLA